MVLQLGSGGGMVSQQRQGVPQPTVFTGKPTVCTTYMHVYKSGKTKAHVQELSKVASGYIRPSRKCVIYVSTSNPSTAVTPEQYNWSHLYRLMAAILLSTAVHIFVHMFLYFLPGGLMSYKL